MKNCIYQNKTFVLLSYHAICKQVSANRGSNSRFVNKANVKALQPNTKQIGEVNTKGIDPNLEVNSEPVFILK